MNRSMRNKYIRVILYTLLLGLIFFTVQKLFFTDNVQEAVKSVSWNGDNSNQNNAPYVPENTEGEVKQNNVKQPPKSGADQKDEAKQVEIQKEKDKAKQKQKEKSEKSKQKAAQDAGKKDTKKAPEILLKDSEKDYRIKDIPAKRIPGYPDDLPIPKRRNIRPLKFRIYSHNIHENVPGAEVENENPWDERVHMVASSINFNVKENTIVTLQEATLGQLNDILERMNRYEGGGEVWGSYGFPNLDGKTAGRMVPIIYKKSEWELVFSYTHWLTPLPKSKNADAPEASKISIVTIATLKHKKTENYINLFNTQLDPKVKQSQLDSTEMLVAFHKSLDQNWPTILVGELNIKHGSKPFKLLEAILVDSAKLNSELTTYGHTKSTVTGFDGKLIEDGGLDNDFMWTSDFIKDFENIADCGKNEAYNFRHHGYALLHTKYMGEYLSDHRPLVGDYIIEPCE